LKAELHVAGLFSARVSRHNLLLLSVS